VLNVVASLSSLHFSCSHSRMNFLFTSLSHLFTFSFQMCSGFQEPAPGFLAFFRSFVNIYTTGKLFDLSHWKVLFFFFFPLFFFHTFSSSRFLTKMLRKLSLLNLWQDTTLHIFIRPRTDLCPSGVHLMEEQRPIPSILALNCVKCAIQQMIISIGMQTLLMR